MSLTSAKSPELLSPAGTLRNLRYALAYGADAVYAGLPRYSLRVRNNDFDQANLAAGIAETHRQEKRLYLAANLMPHGAKLKTFIDDMRPIVELGPDGLIMADPGLILLAREQWPELPIHLSVQANTVNAAAVRFWQQQGLKRVILSRELSLSAIAEIRDACPDIELEVFVHGALCIAYSGRCLLSGYFNHRDANQGACTNACRWEYRLGAPDDTAEAGEGSELDHCQAYTETEPAPARRHPFAESVYLLEEPQRPGDYMPIFEDEHGTYILNSRDLCAIEHVDRLMAMGIDCLKIEGRTKSHYYVARATQAYRAAIDDALASRPFRPELKRDLEGLANRGYTEGFYRRHAPNETQNYAHGASRNQRRIFVGDVRDAEPGWAEVEVRNRFALGDTLELMTLNGNRSFSLERLETLAGEPLEAAPGSGWRVRLPVSEPVGDLALLARALE